MRYQLYKLNTKQFFPQQTRLNFHQNDFPVGTVMICLEPNMEEFWIELLDTPESIYWASLFMSNNVSDKPTFLNSLNEINMYPLASFQTNTIMCYGDVEDVFEHECMQTKAAWLENKQQIYLEHYSKN